MIQSVLASVLFLLSVALGLRAPSETPGWAPDKGFVLVRTLHPDGPAPFVAIEVEKVEGGYPLPEGPFLTNAFGQLWIALYPGTYRFSVTLRNVSPSACEVIVLSGSERILPFLIPFPESRTVPAH